MSEITVINKIELASVLAHRELLNNWSNSFSIYEDDTEGVTVYNDVAQDLFNGYYDLFLTIIEEIKYDK